MHNGNNVKTPVPNANENPYIPSPLKINEIG